ncbi:MAG: hypothetical protein S4CHLAM7_09770 [Chlamydiae bacterium]|nr:hypothetical protein [Chlamydiota bacterium]
MRAIAGLFGKSPFFPLQKHMAKVAQCVDKIPDIFSALKHDKWNKVEKLSDEISKLEHEADLTKNEIRNQLPKSLFLPIEREVLLYMLTLQDSIADTAEDIAILFTMKQTTPPKDLIKEFEKFLGKNMSCFNTAHKIIQELHELFQSSFGGVEAESVKAMTDDVAYKEHEADLIQRDILKVLLNSENELSYASFHLWMRILESIAKISDLSEKLANSIRTTLERR